jgi:hypothetical protein
VPSSEEREHYCPGNEEEGYTDAESHAESSLSGCLLLCLLILAGAGVVDAGEVVGMLDVVEVEAAEEDGLGVGVALLAVVESKLGSPASKIFYGEAQGWRFWLSVGLVNE